MSRIIVAVFYSGKPDLDAYAQQAKRPAPEMRHLLKDPDSLRVDAVFVKPVKMGAQFCYEIGAKNSYGGYERTAVLAGSRMVMLPTATCFRSLFGGRGKNILDITTEYNQAE